MRFIFQGFGKAFALEIGFTQVDLDFEGDEEEHIHLSAETSLADGGEEYPVQKFGFSV